MKKQSFLTLLLILLLPMWILAQEREVRDVGTFTKISFSVPGKLRLKQGSPQRVELVGDADVLKRIKTRVDGGRLRIERESGRFNWGSRDDLTVYVTVDRLEALSVSSSGQAVGEGQFRSEDLDLAVSGSGSITMDAIVEEDVDADVSGSGSINLKGRFGELESDVSGSGKVTIDGQIDREADLSISGSGRIVARGTARDVKMQISGSGKVLAADLEANRCRVSISGSGDVEIHVKEELDARIGGSGTVSYRGNPQKVNSSSSGSGKVRKM